MSIPSQNSYGEPRYPLHALAMAALIAFCFWKFCMLAAGTGLWLDETVTYWITRDSFSDMLKRSSEYQPWRPLYFVLEWLVVHYLGNSELVLRLPSLLAASFSFPLMLRLCRKLQIENAKWLAAAALLGYGVFETSALSARPYALGIMLLLSALNFFVDWCESLKLKDALAFLIAWTLMVYCQFLFVLAGITIVSVLFSVEKRPRFAWILWLSLAAALACGQIFSQFLTMASARSSLSFAPTPALSTLIRSLFPPYLVVGLVVSQILAFLLTKHFEWPIRRSAGAMAAWVFAYASGPLLFFSASRIFEKSIFLERYFAWYVVAGGLMIAVAAARWLPTAAIRVTSVALTATMAFRAIEIKIHPEEWDLAQRSVEALSLSNDTQLILYPGLVETFDMHLIADESSRGYTTAPFAYYPVSNPITVIPRRLKDPEAAAYLKETVYPKLKESHRFILVCFDQNNVVDGSNSCEEIRDTFVTLGFVKSGQTMGKIVQTMAFDNPAKSLPSGET